MEWTSYIEIFEAYFKKNFWGNRDGSSGPNSAYQETKLLRKNLSDLIINLKIESLFDAGCGDLNLIKYLDPAALSQIKNYIGAECVADLTNQNKTNYQNDTEFFLESFERDFVTMDILTDPIPCVDLILCRDVVHYWPNDSIFKFLDNCQRSGSQYLLITHNIKAPISANSETNFGVFRPVNLTQQPFYLEGFILSIQEDFMAKELALFDLKISKFS